MNLKQAREQDKLAEFIKEHEKDAPGDLDKLEATLRRPASQKSKEVPKASSPGNPDD